MVALASGNPFGLDRSLSKGIISALGREFRSLTGRTITGAIQTDAAINPGNSGGPLFNDKGEIIGINSYASEGEGLNFAVRIDEVNDFSLFMTSGGTVFISGFS